MNPRAFQAPARSVREPQFCTLRVGELLIGVDIRRVDEINRHLDVTPVPLAPKCVRGVINLRGEVVTVVDLRTVLGLAPNAPASGTHNVVVHWRGEQIGLVADGIGDVLTIRSDAVDRLPANFPPATARFFQGVFRLPTELLLVLDVDAALDGADTR